MKELKIEDLSPNNGGDGNPVWVACDGKVFDLSASPLWAGGSHMGSHTAGADLTGEIDAAPHGREMLERYPQIGFLREQAVAEKQAVQHWIAESRAEINAARLLVMEVAHKLESGGQYAARVDISLIKFFVANVLDHVLDRAIQVHGGLGITDDTILAFAYRRERAARIYDGPDEVHLRQIFRMEPMPSWGIENSPYLSAHPS